MQFSANAFSSIPSTGRKKKVEHKGPKAQKRLLGTLREKNYVSPTEPKVQLTLWLSATEYKETKGSPRGQCWGINILSTLSFNTEVFPCSPLAQSETRGHQVPLIQHYQLSGTHRKRREKWSVCEEDQTKDNSHTHVEGGRCELSKAASHHSVPYQGLVSPSALYIGYWGKTLCKPQKWGQHEWGNK